MSGCVDIIPAELFDASRKDEVIDFLRILNIPDEGFPAVESVYKCWALVVGVRLTSEDVGRLRG